MNTIRLEEDFTIPGVFGCSATTRATLGAWEDATRHLTGFLALSIREMGN